MNVSATRIRRLAKSTIQNWLTLNIMSEIDLTAPNAKISDNAIVWSADLMDTGLQNPVPKSARGTVASTCCW